MPTRDRRDVVARCVESILHSDYPQIEVIAVDGASSDGTFDHLSKMLPNITILRKEEESLVSYSRNIGCQHAKGQLVFLVDDDNVVHPNALAELVKAISSNPLVGVVGPIMYYLSNPALVWYSGLGRNCLTGTTQFSTLPPHPSMDVYTTEDVPNAFMVKRSVFDDVGFFDQIGFQQHLAESGFCKRATKKGYRVVVVLRATVWHDVPVRKWPYRTLRDLHMTSTIRTFNVARAKALFLKKYAPKWKLVFFKLVSAYYLSNKHSDYFQGEYTPCL